MNHRDVNKVTVIQLIALAVVPHSTLYKYKYSETDSLGIFTLSFIQRCPLQGGSPVQALVTQT